MEVKGRGAGSGTVSYPQRVNCSSELQELRLEIGSLIIWGMCKTGGGFNIG
jgi:hypothetical protein